jgi:hypothetical protein
MGLGDAYGNAIRVERLASPDALMGRLAYARSPEILHEHEIAVALLVQAAESPPAVR